MGAGLGWRMLAGASSVLVLAATLAGMPNQARASAGRQSSQATGQQVTLSQKFGSVTVDTGTGSVTNLLLRNPDGSLPAQSLTGANSIIDSSVTDATGQPYESGLSAPAQVTVGRDQTGAVNSIHLDGIPLTAAPPAHAVTVGPHPNSVAFSPDGKTAYVTNNGNGTVTPINPATGVAGSPITVGGSPSGIAAAPDGDLLVVNNSGRQLLEVDPSSGSIVRAIPVGASPQWPAITPDGKTVLVPNAGSRSVTVADIATGAVEATIPVGATPTDVAIPPGGDRAYVTNESSGSVTPVNLATLQPLPAIPVGAGPIAAAATPDGQSIAVSLNKAGAVVLLNVSSGQVSAPIQIAGSPEDIAISPDGSIAYVNEKPGWVVPIRLATSAVLPSLPATIFPQGNAISPDGRYLLATEFDTGTVIRYDLKPPAAPSPVTEDWAFITTQGGQALQWTITQHWRSDFSGTNDADPSIPFAPGINSTVWYNPSNIYSPAPDTAPFAKSQSTDHAQTLNSTGSGPADKGALESGTWAVYKLWSHYHLGSDLRLGINSGYLTRYASQYGYVSEAGASFEPGKSFRVPAGTTRSLTLTLAPSDRYSTGYQLNASIPDTETLSSLRDFYQSLLNGGTVAGQKAYLFGNEVAGYLTGYEALPDGTALNAGMASQPPTSSDSYSLDAAFRNYLAAMLQSVHSNGQLYFGLSAGGHYQDTALWALLGLYQYTIHTGDLALFRSYQPTIARMLSFWINKIQGNGLVMSNASDGNYYDAVNFGSTYYSTYINAFVYQVLENMADLEHGLSEQDTAAGQAAPAQQDAAAAESYTATAAGIKNALNTVMWAPDSPNGPMYADWIDNDNGQHVYSFMDAAQYPAIAFGIASNAQAKQILSTADARLAQLPSVDGYSGMGTPNVLWPLPSYANTANYAVGNYMNGGMFLFSTYYEILARAMSGDAAGAYARLRGFAQGYQANSWFGTNWAEPSGAVGTTNASEPYLQDMLLTGASLTQGILGIRGTWDALNVTPALPSDWKSAQASTVYRGKQYCVTISNGSASTAHGACHASGGS